MLAEQRREGQGRPAGGADYGRCDPAGGSLTPRPPPPAQVFGLLDAGAVIYFCGLKGMMPGIIEALEKVAVAKGLDWEKYFENLKENHQWRVEVY